MASEKIIALTDENFDELVMTKGKPVLVDFWAPWCGHCRLLNPIIDELAENYSDVAVICKVDVDEAEGLAMNYKIQSIPTVILFKDGKQMDKIEGAKNKSELLALIEENVS